MPENINEDAPQEVNETLEENEEVAETPKTYSKEEVEQLIAEAVSKATEPLLRQISELSQKELNLRLAQENLNLSEEQTSALKDIVEKRNIYDVDAIVSLANRLFKTKNKLDVDKLEESINSNVDINSIG